MDTRKELRGLLKQSETTSEINNEVGVRTKRSSQSRGKECVNESLDYNDELVKYMSKLPSYLQRMESKEESFQSNVLNVGVLDWGRLEKWKHGRAISGERSGKTERKVSTLGVVPNESHRCKIDDQVHTCSNLGKGKAYSRDLQQSVHGVRCTLEPELASRDSFNKQEIATCSYKSSSVIDLEGVNPEKIRRSRSYRESTSGLVSEMGNSMGSQKRATESGKQCVEKLDGEEKIVGDSKAEKQEFSDIVLLRSRKKSQSTLSGEPETSLDDDNMRVARSQIPRSCPISIDLERDSEDMLLPLGVDVSGKKERFDRRRHSKTASRIFDLEMPEDDDESRKIRHHSPSKRFSFRFGRLSRSFTFKEDSAGQPFTSSDDNIKSDSMRFDGLAACPSQSSNPEKQNVHSGSRVSPLRRLLDPLLKSKGSENVLPSKSRSSSSNPTNSDVPLQDEKERDTTSRTRAVFQLTIRNGIPLYQFVVEDNKSSSKSSSRSILGATVKSSASSFKDDSVQYCTFYSVNEVKKKKSGSWLIHGHKEKQRGFVYSVIGQSQLSNSLSSDHITEEKFENVIRESVLFNETEQVKGRKEVAAVVIKKKPMEETLSVIIPGGVHSFPEKGAPSPLISRWRSGGLCDCGGWDVGCKLYVLSNKTLLHDEFNQSFKLFDQEGSEQESALAMTELKTGIYRVEFSSFISALQAFFVCVTVITCGSEAKTTGNKSSSPLAPPLSPVGRV